MLKKYEIKYIINHLHKYPLFLSEESIILMGKEGQNCKIVFGAQTKCRAFAKNGPHLLQNGELMPLQGKNPVEAIYEYYLSLNDGERNAFETAYYALCEDVDAFEKEGIFSDIPLRIIGDNDFSIQGIGR